MKGIRNKRTFKTFRQRGQTERETVRQTAEERENQTKRKVKGIQTDMKSPGELHNHEAIKVTPRRNKLAN